MPQLTVKSLGHRPLGWIPAWEEATQTQESSVVSPPADTQTLNRVAQELGYDAVGEPSGGQSQMSSFAEPPVEAAAPETVPETEEGLQAAFRKKAEEGLHRFDIHYDEDDDETYRCSATERATNKLLDSQAHTKALALIMHDEQVHGFKEVNVSSFGGVSIKAYRALMEKTLGRATSYAGDVVAGWINKGLLKKMREHKEAEERKKAEESKDAGKGKKRMSGPSDAETPPKRVTRRASRRGTDTESSAGPATPISTSPAGAAAGASTGTPKGKEKETEREEQTEDAGKKGRTAEDERVQREVCRWYGHRCILTGVTPVGAHIFPVGLRSDPLIDNFWLALGMFWPRKRVAQWEEALAGAGKRNIFPLSPDAHAMWDRHLFALRPIRDPEDPARSMFVQVDWDTAADVFSGDRKEARRQGDYLTNHWEAEHDGEPLRTIETGDVFKITTKNAGTHPLPSFELLEIQYALHRILGNFSAAGFLKDLFRRPPPRVPPVRSGDSGRLSFLDEYLLECAERADIFSAEDAVFWRAQLVREEAMRERIGRLGDQEWDLTDIQGSIMANVRKAIGYYSDEDELEEDEMEEDEMEEDEMEEDEMEEDEMEEPSDTASVVSDDPLPTQPEGPPAPLQDRQPPPLTLRPHHNVPQPPRDDGPKTSSAAASAAQSSTATRQQMEQAQGQLKGENRPPPKA
ncbi:hypothetical protein CONLIGDRAFT_629164 [Coniochaeta ligniaria NRRL 30616]|uniref:HNH nuclease domain-containing protein n=1 Tax=Coniochaeta ligniaria NRRL 30616 TaxID=1408157 RepID=A0A1J7IUY0_9PEZI|nr:hypothetical protein CONLIGDRAFT_629164 [Coniochaeta ligniaria NRRL 30616]